MACAYFDGSVTVWDIKTGVEVYAPFITGVSDIQATAVAFSPNGTHIAAGYSNGLIYIWDAKENTHQSFTAHNSEITSLTYCSTGRYVLSSSLDGVASVWYSSNCAEVGDPLDGHTDGVTSVAVAPEDKNIITGSLDGSIRIWDFNKHTQIGEPILGHKKGVSCVAYSRCGKFIASGSLDETIIVWDAQKREPIGPPMTGHQNRITGVAFTLDGKYLASSSVDETVRVWDVKTGVRVGDPLYGPRGAFTSIAYSSDGQYLVSGVDGQYGGAGIHNGEICIWDANASTSAGDSPIGLGGWVLSVSCSPDGKQIAAGLQEHILIFETMTGVPLGSPLKAHTSWANSVAHSPDSNFLASGSGDHSVLIWNLQTRQVVATATPGHKDAVNSVVYSADGKYIASASSDKTVCIWDATTGALVGNPLSAHTGPVHFVTYSPVQDGKSYLASCGDDNNIIIWDLEKSSHETLKGHEKVVTAISYSPDGKRLASCSEDDTVRVWDPKSHTLLHVMSDKEIGCFCSIIYSPDGQNIATGSRNDAFCVWDASTNKLIGKPLIGHNGWITSLAYTVDENHIVTASIDHTIRLMVAKPHAAVYNNPSTASINQRSGSPTDLFECFVQAVGPSYSGYELKAKNKVPEDGWIRTAAGELMLWVPPRYRKLVVDRSWICFGYETIGLDCRRFSSGTGWADMKPAEE